MNKTDIQRVLRSFDFKKARWDKCPQGFKEAGYPCFYHDSGAWIELYLTDAIPYGRISAIEIKNADYYGGKFFYTKDQLIGFLKQLFPS